MIIFIPTFSIIVLQGSFIRKYSIVTQTTKVRKHSYASLVFSNLLRNPWHDRRTLSKNKLTFINSLLKRRFKYLSFVMIKTVKTLFFLLSTICRSLNGKVVNNEQKSCCKCKFPLNAQDLYTNEILSDKSLLQTFVYKSGIKLLRLVETIHIPINETLNWDQILFFN